MKIASSYTDAFDLVLDAYKDIGNNLPQFEKYAQLFGDKPSVRKALVDVFEVILNFHKQAMKFFRRSGLCRPSSTVRSEFLGASDEQRQLWRIGGGFWLISFCA